MNITPIKISKLATRTISGLLIISLFYLAIFVGKILFVILISAIYWFMLIEWIHMTIKEPKYTLVGSILLQIPIYSLIIKRLISDDNFLLFTYFVCIWTTDTMCMITGKNIGGYKLCPRISPNKTWSGLIGGCSSSGIALYLFSDYSLTISKMVNNKYYYLLLGFIFGVICQFGDLLMSYYKRKFNIKDSGNLIPGHGGFIDRFDSIILTAPILLLIY